ncbi:MAG: hypothetical protein IJ599_00895 [Alphaproteobacteria bacterium]|nr:hypothetical protein [Alphaproteobacteria bacterium]
MDFSKISIEKIYRMFCFTKKKNQLKNGVMAKKIQDRCDISNALWEKMELWEERQGGEP